ERLSQGPVELILVDVNMPEMFGDDVVEFLRVQRKVAAKLVLYSDLLEDELKRRAEASGADGYITKADGLEAMVSRVKAALSLAPAPGPRKNRVRSVDDTTTPRDLLAAERGARGLEAHTADAADPAPRIIQKKQTRPDLVLLDVNMPKVNGEQL